MSNSTATRPANIPWREIEEAVDTAIAEGMDDLFASIRIPSVVAWGGSHVAESASLLQRILDQDGWRAEACQVGTNHVVVAETGPEDSSAASAVLFYGHHDVQPPEPLDAWTSPPFEPVIREGRLFGRGSADDKGQFFCHIFAVRAVRALLGRVPIPLKFLLDGEEEAGNPNLKRTLDQLGPKLCAGFVFTADGPVHPTGRPRITFGFRGMLQLRLTVQTSSGNLHSGHWGNLAPNAAMLLAQILAEIKAPDGYVSVAGFYDAIRPPSPSERAALEAIPFDPADVAAVIGATRLAGPRDINPMERMMFFPTFTVTGISSGYTGGSFQTSIPARAVAHIDIRYVPDQDPDHIFAVLRDSVSHRAPEAKLERIAHMPPSRTPMDSPLTPLVASAIRKGFGMDPVLLPSSGGSSPDSLFTEGLGMPSLWAHYANLDLRNHAPDENLRLDHLRAGSLASTALILELAARVPQPSR